MLVLNNRVSHLVLIQLTRFGIISCRNFWIGGGLTKDAFICSVRFQLQGGNVILQRNYFFVSRKCQSCVVVAISVVFIFATVRCISLTVICIIVLYFRQIWKIAAWPGWRRVGTAARRWNRFGCFQFESEEYKNMRKPKLIRDTMHPLLCKFFTISKYNLDACSSSYIPWMSFSTLSLYLSRSTSSFSACAKSNASWLIMLWLITLVHLSMWSRISFSKSFLGLKKFNFMTEY